MSAHTVLSLHTYPIKSCAGLTHDAIGFTQAGLHLDRQWVIVDGNSIFMTQRRHPRMALIRPAVQDDALLVQAPGMPAFRVPLQAQPGPAVAVTIWRSDTLGQDEGDDAANALSAFLGQPCRLLRVHGSAQRLANQERVAAWRDQHSDWAADLPQEHAFGFADGFPFLVASQSSLDELNRQLQARGKPGVPMNRFRANIIIDGLDPYEEDYLAGIVLPQTTLAFVKRCTRCPMPNVDQQTASVSDEPGLTLAAHRQFDEGVLFGVNAVASAADGVLQTGDAYSPEYDV